jgi:hypothetical protein
MQPNTHIEPTDLPITGKNLTSQLSGEKPNDDMVMDDAASVHMSVLKPKDDENLPLWLMAMIDYLHRVANDMVWQNLVMEFIKFKKGGPPNGISSLIIFASS